ncbi:MAG: alpha/beta fold hydrolase, partial [Frankiaceae bacterium]
MATVVLILTSAAACSSSAGTMSGTSGPGPTATTGSGAGFHWPVSHPTVWLCRPGMTINPCAGNLDTTVVARDGTGSAEGFRPAATPKIDCFYVYPTLSEAASINAPLAPEPEAVAVTRAQVGRFASLCRLFVPVYRQITLRGLGLALGGQRIPPAARTLAAEDVASAWHDYLNHDNAGRGVLLIGHSQGAIELIALISTELDKNPAERALLVSAILPGGNLLVPAGRDVGGDFQTIPACRTPTQHTCVVAYSMFDNVPPSDSLFGRASSAALARPSGQAPAGMQVLCVNPAALRGGPAPLHPYLPTRRIGDSLVLAGIPTAALPDYPTG